MTKTTINVKIEGQNISILKIRLFFYKFNIRGWKVELSLKLETIEIKG